MPRSQAEVRLAHAVLAGKAKGSNMSAQYAQEVVGKMHGRAMAELPDHTPHPKPSGGLKHSVRQLALLIAMLAIGNEIARGQTPNTGDVVRPNQFPSGLGLTQLPFYDASSNLIYMCSAAAQQTGPSHAAIWAKTPVGPQQTLTSITVLTNVATILVGGSSTIKLQIGNKVTISGSTTSALNGDYLVVTTPGATSITVATSGVADATYSNAALQVSSSAPRSDDSVWSIQKLTYSASSNITLIQWANGLEGGYANSCDARATTVVYQ